MNKLFVDYGIIVKRLPNTMFKVKLISDGSYSTCYLCGKLRITFVKVVIGDKVKLEFCSYNKLKGRIIAIFNEGKNCYKKDM